MQRRALDTVVNGLVRTRWETLLAKQAALRVLIQRPARPLSDEAHRVYAAARWAGCS